MNKQVAVKAKNELSTEMASMMADMDYNQVEARDLKIPKLLLMQQMSKFVAEDDMCKAGDLVNSVTGDVYGSIREKDYKGVKVIPIQMFKHWVIHEVHPDGKMEYVETTPVTPQNTDWEWNEVVEGKKLKRTKCLNFFVLLEKDLGNPLALPHVVTFRSTGYKNGLLLANHFAQCMKAKEANIFRIPMDRVFEIGGGIEKNEKGTFYKLDVKEVSHSSDAAINQAYNWYKTIKGSTSKYESAVDHSDIGETPATSKEF